METRSMRFYFVAAVLAAALAGGGYAAYRSRVPSSRRVASHISTWLDRPRSTMKLMTERYGPPDALAPGIATWRNRGPWKRIVVRGHAPNGCLEQTVSYGVPAAAVVPLLEFGHGVSLDLADDELTASSDDESLNRLALNLAVEIAGGRRDSREAREFYAKTARLSAAGKSSSYLSKILFAPYVPPREDRRRRGVGY